MRIAILLIISLCITVGIQAQKFSLETERIIGNDNDDDYTFLKVADIKFSSDGGLLVADRSRMAVSKYNSRGKFIRRVGRPGKGPQEYVSITSICVGNNSVYVNDAMQNQLHSYNGNLDYKGFLKVDGEPESILSVFEDDSFMGISNFGNNKKIRRFIKLDRKGKLRYSFFNKCWWGDFRMDNKKDQFVKAMGLAYVKGSCKGNRVFFGFADSDNPTEMFVYSTTGKPMLTMRYKFKNDMYKLDHSRLTFQGMKKFAEKLKKREAIYEVKFSAGFMYKDLYIAFIRYEEVYVGGNQTRYNMFLIFDKNGKLIHEEDLCNGLVFYDMNEEGYLVAADPDADVVTVQVHKLYIN